MHTVNFADVVGQRPVALLFATSQLCQSRVCGPVTDIEAQMQAKYGDRMEFIHEEVYVDNDPSKSLRPPLEAFGLQTEPWLFTIDAEGTWPLVSKGPSASTSSSGRSMPRFSDEGEPAQSR